MVVNPQALLQTIELNGGHRIPILGLGTWKLTGESCARIVERALAIGYRHIDTAEVYLNHTDIAPTLRAIPREQLYITSKVPGDCRASDIATTCDEILKELEIEYLDMLLMHWPVRAIPFEETLPEFAKLKAAGKVRSIGVSNFTIRHLKDALACGVSIATNQVEFHPYLYQKELLDFCRQNHIVVTAYSPLARGLLADDLLLNEIGRHHRKTASQVALRWLIQKGMVVIPKTTHEERLVENADVFDFQLSEEEMARIDGLHKHKRLVAGGWTDFDYL